MKFIYHAHTSFIILFSERIAHTVKRSDETPLKPVSSSIYGGTTLYRLTKNKCLKNVLSTLFALIQKNAYMMMFLCSGGLNVSLMMCLLSIYSIKRADIRNFKCTHKFSDVCVCYTKSIREHLSSLFDARNLTRSVWEYILLVSNEVWWAAIVEYNNVTIADREH